MFNEYFGEITYNQIGFVIKNYSLNIQYIEIINLFKHLGISIKGQPIDYKIEQSTKHFPKINEDSQQEQLEKLKKRLRNGF